MNKLPHDYYSMSIDDAALMFKGWYDQQENEFLLSEWIARKQTILLGDVINRSLGGKGADKAIKASWKHPWDKGTEKKFTAKDKLELRKQQAKQWQQAQASKLS